MPRYTFRCEECGGEQLLFRPVTDPDRPASCSECAAPARRVFDPGSVQLQIPWRFRRHVDVTGLKSDLGNGPGCEVNHGRSRGQVLRTA